MWGDENAKKNAVQHEITSMWTMTKSIWCLKAIPIRKKYVKTFKFYRTAPNIFLDVDMPNLQKSASFLLTHLALTASSCCFISSLVSCISWVLIPVLGWRVGGRLLTIVSSSGGCRLLLTVASWPPNECVCEESKECSTIHSHTKLEYYIHSYIHLYIRL